MKYFQFYLILLVIFLSLINCQGQKKNTMKIKYNEVNTIKGIYLKSDLTQKKNNQNAGYYKIKVNDTLEICLLPPYNPKAIRPQEEIVEMEGKMVHVTGIILHKTYLEKPGLENEPLSINKPCFITIESIRLIE